MLLTISGCTQESSTPNIHDELNQKVDFPVVLPEFDQYVLNYAAIETSPVSDKRKTITLGYAPERNESTKLTKEEKETLKNDQNKEVLLGNPKNENNFYINIDNSEAKLVNGERTTISGYEVQYWVGDQNANYVLNTAGATYSLNVIFSQTSKQARDGIVKSMVEQISKTK